MLKKLKNKIRAFLCKRNYKSTLHRIKKYPRDRKIRVLFYVSENSKWGYQYLYEEFEKSEFFEPIICVGILNNVHCGNDTTRMNLEENYNFFQSRGMRVKYAYKNHEYIDLRTFKPDIVFYEQPWDLPRIYKPHIVSRYALTCYCPYSFKLFKFNANYTPVFHNLLWKNFTETEVQVKYYETCVKNASRNCVITGYPKLDVFLDNSQISTFNWKHPEKYKIIYAPHHSLSSTSLQLATFKQNGDFILEWAKSQPNTTWVFKAHPQFQYAILQEGIMNEKELNNYIKEWETLGIVYRTGNYFDIFKTSDLMITDCGSFLAEYLLTGKPLIRLSNPNSIELNLVGEKIVSAHYKTYNNNDLANTLNSIVKEHNDYMQPQRLAIKQELFGENVSASKRVYQHILSELNLTGDKNDK